ncbi:hypothetical protein DFH06DRAFT_1125377 [Mycena polygramma]|nr:hypothetical protein DFH06DRAFT_1141824 [Mycena polygramma]KAJ7669968.1 hypothetical protein DFH06DRAFT_1125377 [Mycena polygramma]
MAAVNRVGCVSSTRCFVHAFVRGGFERAEKKYLSVVKKHELRDEEKIEMRDCDCDWVESFQDQRRFILSVEEGYDGFWSRAAASKTKPAGALVHGQQLVMVLSPPRNTSLGKNGSRRETGNQSKDDGKDKDDARTASGPSEARSHGMSLPGRRKVIAHSTQEDREKGRTFTRPSDPFPFDMGRQRRAALHGGGEGGGGQTRAGSDIDVSAEEEDEEGSGHGEEEQALGTQAAAARGRGGGEREESPRRGLGGYWVSIRRSLALGHNLDKV